MWKRPENEPSPSPGASNPHSVPGAGPGPTPSQRPPAARGEVASIGASITVKGDISGEEDLLVQGRVEGTIDLKTNHVTVGREGRVKADIHGRVIDVQGEVEGNLFGDEQVVVRQTGEVRGNITAPRVSLEDGANFKGTIDMEPKPRSRVAVAGRETDRAAVPAGGPPGHATQGNGKGAAEQGKEATPAGAQKALPTGTEGKPGAGSSRG